MIEWFDFIISYKNINKLTKYNQYISTYRSLSVTRLLPYIDNLFDRRILHLHGVK